ncbi:MAG: hypothetical protein N2D54_03390, partial [Chloroflexota bacterium]
MRVFLSRELDTAQEESFRALLDQDIHINIGLEPPEPPDYDVLVMGRPGQSMIHGNPSLKRLVIPWAGLPNVTKNLMGKYPHISVHNLHHNAQATAETALMLLFAAAKQIIPIETAFREHDWRPRYEANPAMLLAGKTIVILGFGQIGQRVGKICEALGMETIGIRRDSTAESSINSHATIYPPDALAKLLPKANVLMVTLPHTPETENLIGAQEFNLLPEQSILVNVGRGVVIDQEALYTNLKNGKLHSA